MMVSVGLGWAVLPKMMLDDSICEINVENIHLSHQLGVITDPQRTMSNAAQAFFDLLLSSCD